MSSQVLVKSGLDLTWGWQDYEFSFSSSFLAGCVAAFSLCSLGHMQSSSGDCPLEGRA